MEPIELYCEETEGWPYDGSQTTFVYKQPRFVLTTVRRHIDADDERSDVEVMTLEQGLVWLREAGVSMWRLSSVLASVLAETELVASYADAEKHEIRRVGQVWLLRSRTTREEQRWGWLDLAAARERLHAAGWASAKIEAALPRGP